VEIIKKVANTKLVEEMFRRLLTVKNRKFKQTKELTVVGDSHTSFFSGNQKLIWRRLTYHTIYQNKNIGTIDYAPTRYQNIKIYHIGAPLAYNINKYNTGNLGREKVEYLIDNGYINENSQVMVCLGEIDLRVHVLKQAEKAGKTKEEIVDSILDNYMAFLHFLKSKGLKPIVWGPVASQIDGEQLYPDYPYYGSEADRNRATAYFNNCMKQRCDKHQMGFVSIFEDLIDENYKTKTKYFFDGCHLGQNAMEFAMTKLKDVLGFTYKK